MDTISSPSMVGSFYFISTTYLSLIYAKIPPHWQIIEMRSNSCVDLDLSQGFFLLPISLKTISKEKENGNNILLHLCHQIFLKNKGKMPQRGLFTTCMMACFIKISLKYLQNVIYVVLGGNWITFLSQYGIWCHTMITLSLDLLKFPFKAHFHLY
jgi:hypothetical protein